jgi:nucleoid-associated protein YgaU
MLRCLFTLALVASLVSCAKPPHQELDAAEHMVRRARDLRAMDFAPVEYQAARTALSDARMAMDKADYGDARDSVEYALQHARRAVSLAEEGQARLEQEEAEQAILAEQARQAEQKKAKTENIEIKQEQKQPAAKPAAKPAPVLTPKPQIELVDEYSVGEGETLWTISAQPQVYGEGLLWPLLYQANRDQIKDPRQIFPGQTLGIRRDMTSKELEEARQRARESDIFPVPGTTLQGQ